MNSYLLLVLIAIFVTFSAICSGLNVSLMNLDTDDLKRKSKLKNRKAKRILPLRENYHLSLAALLITNVASVSGTSLALNTKFNGLLSGAMATLLIVIVGEILPQALFINKSIEYTYRFSGLLKLMIVFTYPLSKPLQLILDRLFPRKNGKLQSRKELSLLISEHLADQSSELDNDEVFIIRGALQLSEKRVRDIMTPIDNTYYFHLTDILNDKKMDQIKEKGYSRIPVLNKELTDCYGVILMKELIDIDFDNNVYRVADMKIRPSPIVGSMTALDTLFRKYIIGKSHLLPVEKDDKIVGVVTIEDLLEEIIGHEIEDETDTKN